MIIMWYGKEFQTFEPRFLKLLVPGLTRLTLVFLDLDYSFLVLNDSSFSVEKYPL